MKPPRTIGSLFSGVGGLELGLEWATGASTLWQCELDPFCRSVLATHWPHATRYEDVTQLSNPPPADLICGGFPCQDISSAGKGAGLSGERSGLWYQFARIVEQNRPEWVVVENVASGARRWVDAVCGQLGQLGYETLPIPISAADIGAPHLRRRIFIVAHAAGQPVRLEQQRGPGGRPGTIRDEGQAQPIHDGGPRPAPDANGQGEPVESKHGQVGGVPSAAGHGGWGGGPAVPPGCGVDDGRSSQLDRARLKALGNAVVPQCAEVIGHVILELCHAR